MTESEDETEVKMGTYLLELLDGTTIDTSALVNQVACDDISMRAHARIWRRLTGGGGLAAVDVADDDHVDVHLLFTIAAMSAMFIVLFCDLHSMK